MRKGDAYQNNLIVLTIYHNPFIMSPTANGSWLVLFSVVPGQYQRSLVIFRQFIEQGLGPGVTVIDDAYLPSNQGFCFFFIVTAADESVIQNAISPASGIYDMTWVKIEDLSFDPAAGAANYCIYGCNTAPGPAIISTNPEEIRSSVQVRTAVTLPEGPNISFLYLVHAASGNDALQFGYGMHPGTGLTSTDAIASAPYYEQQFGAGSTAGDSAVAPAAVAAIDADPNDEFTIINEGTNDMYCFTSAVPNPDTVNFICTDFFRKRQVIHPGQSLQANRKAFIWNQQSGPLYYVLNYSKWSSTPPYSKNYSEHFTTQSNCTHPVTATPDMTGCKGAVLSFNKPGQQGFQVNTQLSQWLQDILLNTTYDLPWPEDTYTGDELAAYNYILGQIKIILGLDEIVAPKSGNIPADTFNKITYPAGAAFAEAAFTSVNDHLFAECTYFDKSKDWFAANGIISVINSQVAIVSADDLTAAANLMEIPKTSQVSVILDTVISAISSIVAAIPGEGAAISAAINIGWSVAKLSMQPGQDSEPIQASLADMADILIERLQYVVNATATQYSTINNNWGKLKQFGTLVIEGKITADMFGIQAAAANNAVAGKAKALQPPQGYIMAAAKAWSVIIFKALFTTQHQPSASIELTTNLPSNPWNPANDNYNYVYAMNCLYYDSKQNKTNGYIVFHCSCGAATQAMRKLFSNKVDIPLHVDPVEFFLGFNGWPNIEPWLGNNESASSPIISVGY